MYFCGQFNLDDWDDDAEYIIFDDFSEDFKFFPHYKLFFGRGRNDDFTITDKYKPKTTVCGKPSIWLGNRDFREFSTVLLDLDWLSANCTFVTLYSPLFNNLPIH